MLDHIAAPKRGKRVGKDKRERTLKPSPATANRVLGVLQACFAWAIEHDRLERAPAWPKPPGVERARTRVLSPEELKAVWWAASAEEARGNTAGSFVKMLAILGQRRTETASMRFEDIAEEPSGWWWTIPTERTKNGRAHRVPLTSLARDVVEHRRGRGEATWVFPTDRPSEREYLATASHVLARLREACPSLAHWTLHDLRRTMATALAEQSVPLADIGAVLNHSRLEAAARVTAVHYAHYQRDREKRVALETWERRLREIVSGEAAAPADVVPITAARG